MAIRRSGRFIGRVDGRIVFGFEWGWLHAGYAFSTERHVNGFSDRPHGFDFIGYERYVGLAVGWPVIRRQSIGQRFIRFVVGY